MPSQLKPNTQEWLDALEKQNPTQAAQTKQMISLAGKSEVCSICGDEESNDYILEGAQEESEIVATLRLCNDCFGIRKMHGENFLPFNK
jgi:hypothetical protein